MKKITPLFGLFSLLLINNAFGATFEEDLGGSPEQICASYKKTLTYFKDAPREERICWEYHLSRDLGKKDIYTAKPLLLEHGFCKLHDDTKEVFWARAFVWGRDCCLSVITENFSCLSLHLKALVEQLAKGGNPQALEVLGKNSSQNDL